ncbi:MAG: lipase family protein [Bacteroides sp.]|jgi:pimeloyl-ACP methyl ester carboxylesterase|nr:lipase family protein [Bacteroides sp.]
MKSTSIFNINLFNRIFLLLFLFTIAISCQDDDNPEPYEPIYLESYEKVMTLSREEVQELITSGGLFPPAASAFVQYGVTAVRITYHTIDVEGEPILASGALLVPQANAAMPMLSFQHGTLANASEAPSLFESLYTDQLMFFASTGFHTALPDYIGYGVSADREHPYEHRASLATATRDMIRASYEYYKVENLEEPDNRLYLTGYSEGGFATMATLKLMQEEHSDEFLITAATVGAGAYNKTATAEYVISSNENQEYINTFVWVLDVYNRIYPQLQRPYSHYFNEPWASQIEQNGVFTPIELNPSFLFRSEFIESVLDGTDTEMLDALADNDCYDWRPDFPIRLFHGDADRLVPYLNSQTAYQAMVAQGTQNIELITTEGGTHETTLESFITGTFNFFFSVQAKEGRLE